jgi:hypothetical protein
VAASATAIFNTSITPVRASAVKTAGGCVRLSITPAQATLRVRLQRKCRQESKCLENNTRLKIQKSEAVASDFCVSAR